MEEARGGMRNARKDRERARFAKAVSNQNTNPLPRTSRKGVRRKDGAAQAPAPTASSSVTDSGARVSMKELTENTALPAPATP